MDIAPPEIIHSILTYISSETDIANFRLVQHSFADLGAEFLFRIIHIDFSKSSLSRLISLSSGSNLARYVKAIFVKTGGGIAKIIWPEYIKILDLNGISYHDRSGRATEMINPLISSFDKSLYSGDLAKEFGIVLRGFPKLKAVTVSCPTPYHLSGPILPGLTYLWHYISTKERLYQPADYTRMFTTLVSILYLGGVKLDSFEILGIERLITGCVFFRSPETVRRAKIVFRNCKSIALSIELKYGTLAHSQQSNSLSLALAFAKRLEKLHVVSYTRDRPNINHGNPEAILFSTIVRTKYVWPKLKTVAFPSIMMHENEIVGFLSRHKATLREVSMGRSILRTSSWVDVMRFIKQNMKLVKLNISQLEDFGGLVYSDEEKDMIVEYVLGDGQLPERANLPGLDMKLIIASFV